MKILCIGDVVGKPGRRAINELLEVLVKEHSIDFVMINGENAAGGAGITARITKQFLRKGCHVVTLGDHTWDQKELEEYLTQTDDIIRPANFPEGAPGKGWCIKTLPDGTKVGVINLLGRVFMRYSVLCPFLTLEKIVKEIKKETPIIIVDMHAEATSEKVAMGYFIDGEVSVIVGTHTHIQTADEKILAKGTAYITDLGMTGPYDSVIGQDKERIIQRFLTSLPKRFSVATDDVIICGVIVSVDEKTGKATNIERLQHKCVDLNYDEN